MEITAYYRPFIVVVFINYLHIVSLIHRSDYIGAVAGIRLSAYAHAVARGIHILIVQIVPSVVPLAYRNIRAILLKHKADHIIKRAVAAYNPHRIPVLCGI